MWLGLGPREESGPVRCGSGSQQPSLELPPGDGQLLTTHPPALLNSFCNAHDPSHPHNYARPHTFNWRGCPAGSRWGANRRLPWATLNIAGLRPKPQAQGPSAHRQQARPPNGHHPKCLCAGSVLHMGHLPACPRPGPQAGSPAAGFEGERLPLVRGGASGPQWDWCSRSCHTSSWPFKDLPSGSVTSPRVGKDFSERTSLGNVLSGSGDHLVPERSRDENTVPPRTLP